MALQRFANTDAMGVSLASPALAWEGDCALARQRHYTRACQPATGCRVLPVGCSKVQRSGALPSQIAEPPTLHVQALWAGTSVDDQCTGSEDGDFGA